VTARLFQARNFHILQLKSRNVYQHLFPRRLALALFFLTNILVTPAWAQFKKVFEPDSVILLSPSYFTAIKVLETDLPGRELLTVGTLTTQDSGGTYRLAAYTLFSDLHGNPQAMYIFEDTSAFVFQGPKVYGACYGGNGEVYSAMGTNGAQVVLKTNVNGQLVWSRAAFHHEFYSILCEGSSVVVLGQDESIQGAHDNALLRLNADGSLVNGNMYGTTDFETPQKVARIGNHYLTAGNSFQGSGFAGMVVKADTALNQVWGNSYLAANKSVLSYGIAEAADGNGYMASGIVRGGVDSLFLMKLDTMGNPLWVNYYGITGATEANNFALTQEVETGGYLLAGSYRKTGYLRPYILLVDSLGAVQWARDYGDPGVNTDEILNDVVHFQADDFYYAVGDMVDVDSNLFLHKVFTVKFAADSGIVSCDSVLQVVAVPGSFQIGPTTVEEPFGASVAYPMGNLFPVRMNVETRCTVIVGVADDAPRTGVFHFANPSSGELNLKVEVQSGGGTLRVVSMGGQVVLERRLEEGMQEVRYELPYLSNGLYLVTVEGEGWRYPMRRWAVVNE
jgi:hypothetical protein